MKYQSVLFDLDGTLLDTAPDLLAAVNLMREARDLMPLSIESFRGYASGGSAAIIKLAFNVASNAQQFSTLRTEFLSHYDAISGTHTQLFPHIATVLTSLDNQQIPWGIVTNKSRQFTLPLMSQFSLAGRCGVLVCGDDLPEHKPDPKPLLFACKHLNTIPEKSIYIGDDERDIQAGKAASMDTVGVLYGYTPKGKNPHSWHATEYINAPLELMKILS